MARSGVVAAVLWCFSPNVLAWSATICPDAPAGAMGAAAGYVFWRWLKRPDWFNTLGCGILLGLVQLTKTTWIILFALWPAIWGPGAGAYDYAWTTFTWPTDDAARRWSLHGLLPDQPGLRI